MTQIKKSYSQVTVPLTKMSFTPDVPSAALGSNEYNIGENVEADVRGIRSVNGDEFILPQITGTPFYVTAGYRPAATPEGDNEFWFIVATINDGTNEGKWWMSNGGAWTDITPPSPPFDGSSYAAQSNITEAWNGTVVIFNDGVNPPFFLPDEPNATLISYVNNVQPKRISDITAYSATIQRIEVTTPYVTRPFVPGDRIVITDVNGYYNGQFEVADIGGGVGSTVNYIYYLAVPGAAYPVGTVGSVAAAYTWNYNPNWESLTAGFIRIYSTPNVGNILVAGNLTAVPKQDLLCNTATSSATVACTQATSALVSARVSGPGIPAGTVVNSVSTGVSVTLSQAATATATGVTLSFGLNTVESYPVTVRNSQAFGQNAAPLTWEPTNLNVANEFEVPVRGEVIDAFPCNGQLFVCSYWDTIVLTPLNYATTSTPILGVRLFNQGRGLLNANCWANTDDRVYGVDSRDIWVFNGSTFVGIGNQRVKHWFFDQLDRASWDMVYVDTNTEKNQIEIYYADQDATPVNPLDPTGRKIPNKMLSYRHDLDCWNAPRDVTVATFACESPVWTYNDDTNEWLFNPASRTIVYAQGVDSSQLVQKDTGYYFREINGDPRDIVATFRRDNIKLVKDYSSKTLVHRILPEAVNLNNNNVEINPVDNPELVGNVAYTVEGANSVGQAPQQVTVQALSTDTDYPWIQINQNAHRVNSVEFTTPIDANATPGTIWMVNALTFQFTEVEDDR